MSKKIASTVVIAFTMAWLSPVFSASGDGPVGTMIDLGSLGGSFTVARDINDSGIVVGMAGTFSGGTRGFFWRAGGMTDIGTIGGASTFSNAVAVNRYGAVAATSGHAVLPSRVFLWRNGIRTELGSLNPGGSSSSGVSALNDLTQIVGVSQIASGEYHAFLWQNGTMIDLGTLGGSRSRNPV